MEQRYVGEMRAGKNEGHGTLYNVDGERFDGEWADDQRVRGTETYANGMRYVGTYRDDKASGVGTLTYPSGAHYSGDFVNARFEGHGKFTEADGSYYVGEFRRGLPNGYGTLHQRDGRSISGNWNGGCLRNGTQVASAGVTKEQCGFR